MDSEKVPLLVDGDNEDGSTPVNKKGSKPRQPPKWEAIFEIAFRVLVVLGIIAHVAVWCLSGFIYFTGRPGWWSAKPLEADFSHLQEHCAHILPPSTDSYYIRQAKLGVVLEEAGAAAWIAEPGASSRYFVNVSQSDWGLSERPMLLVVQPGPKLTILTPKFEAARAATLEPFIPARGSVNVVSWAEDEDPYTVLKEALGGLKVVLDSEMRLFVAQGLSHAGFHTSDSKTAVRARAIRERKDEQEVGIMKCVNEVTLLAVRAVREKMYIGMRESEAKALMKKALTDAGLANEGVFTTVLFGANAAFPHGRGSDSELGEQDFAVFDVGGTLHGYWSDVTRTFALPESKIPTSHLEIWQTVHEAQLHAIAEATRGTKAQAVDAAARNVIAKAGYGDKFTHRLGHGIGLQLHESPYLRGGYESRLEKGNAFSNEPGIYIEGEIGVRLEDCFVVTESGPGEILTAGVGGMARSPWMP